MSDISDELVDLLSSPELPSTDVSSGSGSASLEAAVADSSWTEKTGALFSESGILHHARAVF